MDYFKETQDRFHRKFLPLLTEVVCISESDGYDAFVTMWNKIVTAKEEVIKKLKEKSYKSTK